MKILFIHQNFPGQYKFLAPALVENGHEVTAMTMQTGIEPQLWQGVKIVPYKAERGTTKSIHPWLSDFETKIIRAEACFQAALNLKSGNFTPDLIIAHHGWGESLFLKEIWPNAKLAIYCEFYYHPTGADVGFDPEFNRQDPALNCQISLKNINNLLHFQIADVGISPTQWQASTFPAEFRKKISVIHDGIDTEFIKPFANVRLQLKKPNGQDFVLTRNDEVITFVNRNLEPYRGFHIFMRALPDLLRQRPNAKVLIVGGDDVSYGGRPDPAIQGATSWRDVYINEVRHVIDDESWGRVHFLGHIPYKLFIPLLQLSTVHVYLTYPFVLSWSLLEAMSAGCAIVASNTMPLLEAIKHNETGRLFNFFDSNELVEQVCYLLNNPNERIRLGANAREFAKETYDLKSVCLPRQLEWIESLIS